jgi:hypothetical protein
MDSSCSQSRVAGLTHKIKDGTKLSKYGNFRSRIFASRIFARRSFMAPRLVPVFEVEYVGEK